MSKTKAIILASLTVTGGPCVFLGVLLAAMLYPFWFFGAIGIAIICVAWYGLYCHFRD